MQETILAVDDEPRILSSYQRNLGDRFQILTAEGPEPALAAIKTYPIAVVLTDLKMPGMDGIELLKKTRELQPDTVRIMISGHADLSDAINSVNNAGIFRLLIKPCPVEDLSLALYAGIVQYRLVTAEKALLEQTLNGAIETLTDILSILDTEAFGHAQLRKQIAKAMARQIKAPEWEFEMAALLSEIGRATLPPMLNEKLVKHSLLSEVESKLVARIPQFSYQLLAHIPRIEHVARAVLYQNKHFDGSGFPDDDVFGDDIPLASRALHMINAAMLLCQQGNQVDDAIQMIRRDSDKYDERLVDALRACDRLLMTQKQRISYTGPQEVKIKELVPGMVLLGDITTKDGVLVMGSGAQLSGAQIQRIINYSQINAVVEPIMVELKI